MKRLIILLVFLAASATSYAQEGFRFGFRLTPLVSTVRAYDQDKKALDELPSGKAGISAGLMGIYGFTEKVGLYTGLLFTSKGMGYKNNNGVGWGSNKWQSSLTTLEIPLALHLLSNEVMPGMKIRGLFGLQNNILIGVTNKFDDVTDKNRENYSFFVPDLLVGLGVEWNLEKVGTLDLGISYHHGLGNFYKSPELELAGKKIYAGYKINYIGLDLGYIF
jgi:hypothetical protein